MHLNGSPFTTESTHTGLRHTYPKSDAMQSLCVVSPQPKIVDWKHADCTRQLGVLKSLQVRTLHLSFAAGKFMAALAVWKEVASVARWGEGDSHSKVANTYCAVLFQVDCF